MGSNYTHLLTRTDLDLNKDLITVDGKVEKGGKADWLGRTIAWLQNLLFGTYDKKEIAQRIHETVLQQLSTSQDVIRTLQEKFGRGTYLDATLIVLRNHKTDWDPTEALENTGHKDALIRLKAAELHVTGKNLKLLFSNAKEVAAAEEALQVTAAEEQFRSDSSYF
jgi:hypothetical protein